MAEITTPFNSPARGIGLRDTSRRGRATSSLSSPSSLTNLKVVVTSNPVRIRGFSLSSLVRVLPRRLLRKEIVA